MQFEGTEKKFELTVGDAGPGLRALGDAYWAGIVELADAQVLSKISNDSCDAYLLSESSLFVWDRKVLMITCGTTRLPRAATALLQQLNLDHLTGFFYERKNEIFPHLQHSSFLEDARQLARSIPGRAFQFGHRDEHHLNLFSLEREGGARADDGTVEILMYGLDDEVRDRFGRQPNGGDWLRSQSVLAEHFAGAQVDEHTFEPRGYSLNALFLEDYSTLHVSPNEIGSYASFETNRGSLADLDTLVSQVTQVFRPRAFDLVVFDVEPTVAPVCGEYQQRFHQSCSLKSGYELHFISFHRPEPGIHPPDELQLRAGEDES